MMKLLNSYFKHEDDRGRILGIIQEGTWKELNYLTAKADSIRGGHFHKETTEIIFVIRGRATLSISYAGSKKVEQSVVVVGGDIILIEPGDRHTFQFVEDSELINILSEPMKDPKDIWDAFTVEEVRRG